MFVFEGGEMKIIYKKHIFDAFFFLVIILVLLYSCEKNNKTSEENNSVQFFKQEPTDNIEDDEDTIFPDDSEELALPPFRDMDELFEPKGSEKSDIDPTISFLPPPPPPVIPELDRELLYRYEEFYVPYGYNRLYKYNPLTNTWTLINLDEENECVPPTPNLTI
jgi:hypothetical protein